MKTPPKKKRSTARILRKLSTGFLVFLMVVTSVLCLSLLIIKTTLFNFTFIENTARISGYYENITKQINLRIEDLGRGGNVPSGILSEMVQRSTVKKDVDSFFQAAYIGNTFVSTGSEIVVKDVTESIQVYAKQKELDLEDSAVFFLANEAMITYNAFIELPYVMTFGTYIRNYQSVLDVLLITSAAATALSLLCIAFMYKKLIHRLFRYLAYTLLASGLMLSIFSGTLLASGVVARIGITSEYLYHFVTLYITSFLHRFLLFGISVFVAGLLSVAVSEILRKRLIHRTSRKRKDRYEDAGDLVNMFFWQEEEKTAEEQWDQQGQLEQQIQSNQQAQLDSQVSESAAPAYIPVSDTQNAVEIPDINK